MRCHEGNNWPTFLGELPGRAAQGGWYLIHGAPYHPDDRRWPPGNYRAAPAEDRYRRPVNCGVDFPRYLRRWSRGARPPGGFPIPSVAIQYLPSLERPSDSGGEPEEGRRAPVASPYYGIPSIRPNYGVALMASPSWNARAGCAEPYVTHILAVYRRGFPADAAHQALLSTRRPMALPLVYGSAPYATGAVYTRYGDRPN